MPQLMRAKLPAKHARLLNIVDGVLPGPADGLVAAEHHHWRIEADVCELAVGGEVRLTSWGDGGDPAYGAGDDAGLGG